MVHPWPAFSPEANYTALASGSGPASTLAYAETLSAQAAQVQAVVAASAASAAATYGTTWRGVGATASAVAQAALDTQHELLAAALLEKASHVAAAAGARQSAVASMVTAQEAEANRRDEATAQQLNPLVWGALTPQIVALNLEYYGQMWPRNAAAGAAYGAALRAAATAIMVPFPPAVRWVAGCGGGGGGRNRGDQRGRSNHAGQRASRPRSHRPGDGRPTGRCRGDTTCSPIRQRTRFTTSIAEYRRVGGHPTPAHTTRAPRAPVGMFAPRSPAGPLPAPTATTPGGQGLASSQLSEALQSCAGILTRPRDHSRDQPVW
ncbi:PPE domain-containing protein [Mycobacterium ostraviense]|uniref:PPE domain-containing protein n=1 Tax=Mycobacterium ostraviense TaxID=2738409 RepID=UPI00137B53A8|nr:PPE domain-containing protein [Mycobacterium ostraviense]UGT89621.1 PPE domain-containing protein [Mycobacterium ostraviense]